MRDLMMIGIALAFTGVLVLLRSLLVGRRQEQRYRVSVMKFTDGGGGASPDSADEWPAVIGAEDDSLIGDFVGEISERAGVRRF